MKRLVAIESPIRPVASLLASRKSQASAPAAASIDSCSVFDGKARSGWRVNSPVMVSCVLTIAREAPGSSLASASGAGADDQVAAEQQVGAAGAQAHGVQRLGAGADAHVADHRAALLRHAELVEHGGALALDVRGHAHDGADGHHAGAADAGDQHAVGLSSTDGRTGAAAAAARPRRRPAWRPALPLRSLPPSTVTKLGQKPLRQE